MKNKIVIFIVVTFMILNNINIYAETSGFAYGADVSWLPQMEENGFKFYDDSGVEKNALEILKSHGMNAIRLRVWVSPSNDKYSGHSSVEETVKLAQRVTQLGFRLMIDFHYSDSWADPGKQTKPSLWTNHNISQLTKDVYDFTYNTLITLKQKGISPEWVQVGNETNNGMLWDEGKASTNMKNFADLITSGYNAVKAVNSNTKVIVHLSNGNDNSLFRWMFDGLKNNNAKYDVIGMSLYPDPSNWQEMNQYCLNNVKDMISRYNKEVMICEVGMRSDDVTNSKAFLTDIISKMKSTNKALGVFYWEPQSYNWAYGKEAWQTNGRPSQALDAFINEDNTILYGDLNADKKVTSTDVSLVERYILGVVNFDQSKLILADMNKDSRITSSDVSLIERYILGN